MARQIKPEQEFKERFIKLIPIEIVSIWLFAVSQISTSSDLMLNKWLSSVLAVVLLGLLPIYMGNRLYIESWKHKFASMLSFVIWVYAVPSGPFVYWGLYHPLVAGIIFALGMLVIPMVYKESPEDDRKPPSSYYKGDPSSASEKKQGGINRCLKNSRL